MRIYLQEKLLVPVILAAGLLVQLYFIFSVPFFFLKNDDAYYYFAIAKHAFTAGFWSFDGIEATNGVQPLWELLLNALYPLFAHAPAAAFPHAVLVLCALLNICAGLFLFLLAKRLWKIEAGYILLLLWLFLPYIFLHQLDGVENALNSALFAGFLYCLLLSIERFTLKRIAVVGILCGLLCLVRIDYILLALVVGLYITFGSMRLVWTKELFARGGIFAAGWGIIVLPYLAIDKLVFGSFLPISGSVKLWMAGQYYASLPHPLILSAASAFAHGTYFAIKGIILGIFGKGIYFFITVVSPHAPAQYIGVLVAVCLAGVPIALVICNLLVRRHQDGVTSPHKSFWLIVSSFVVLHLLLVIAMYPNQILYAALGWWLVPEYIAGFFLITRALLYLGAYKKFRAIYVLVLAANAALALWGAAVYTSSYPDTAFITTQEAKYQASAWIVESADFKPGTTLGAFNAGILGYFSPYPVYNLDGLANNAEFFAALKQNNVAAYVQEKKIDYIADYGVIADGLFRNVPVESAPLYAEPIVGYGGTFYVLPVRKTLLK